MKKVLIVGNSKDSTNLEASYKRAFIEIGCDVQVFDPYQEQKSIIKLGKLGQILHTFLPVEEWRRKMNKIFVLKTKTYSPDLIVVFCNAPILAQSLAFLKVSMPVKTILVWPDPMVNISSNVINASKVYDLVASFSKKSIEVFTMLGFNKVEWVPLAGDKQLHFNNDVCKDFEHDICFIGAYRPERGDLMEYIKHMFPDVRLKIYGTDWNKYKGILKNDIVNKALRGAELSDKFNKSLININTFDETGLGAANMRFFEISMARGLQICSQCVEMENSFLEGEHIFYYKNNTALAAKISYCLDINNADRLNYVRENAHNFVIKEHQYINRASQLLHNWIED